MSARRAVDGSGEATPLRAALDEYLHDYGLAPASTLAEIAARWPQFVGADVAVHVVPWRVDDDELVVAVTEPAWATEVAFLTETILTVLARELGGRAPSRLKAHVRRSFDVE